MKQALFFTAVLLLMSCSDNKNTKLKTVEKQTELAETVSVADYLQPPTNVDFLVYKSPTCGCCAEWVTHMDEAGYTSHDNHQADLAAVKAAWKINPSIQSCHTAVSREGYIFEGHIPAHVIQRFLAERPRNAIGLAVAGMPIGSPGMEMGDRFEPYDVRLIRKDGTTVSFTRITQPR